MKNKIKFLIVSTIQRSGGSIVLHYLCKLLIDKGYNAKIFLLENSNCTKEKYTNILKFWGTHCIFIIKCFIKSIISSWFINQDNYTTRYAGFYYKPVKGVKIKYLPFYDKKNTVVVYPEIVYGNFLKAKNVVRWLLFYNRYTNDTEAFDNRDLFFAYREIFNDKRLNPLNRIFCLHYYDLDLYKQTNFSDRNGVCYVIRKGRDRDDLPNFFDGPIIDDFSEFKIVETFNKCKYCILYDTQTAYGSIAALCGCIPIVMPEEGKRREDYCSNGEKRYGIAFGNSREEIDWAVNTRGKLIESFKKNINDDYNQVNNFISLCFKYFNMA